MNAGTRWVRALERIEELRELEQAATPAPWDAYPRLHDLASATAAVDAELIATARNLLPGLLDLVESVVRVHEPVVAPGEAVCHHCVHLHTATHRLWPCDPIAAAFTAVGHEEPTDVTS